MCGSAFICLVVVVVEVAVYIYSFVPLQKKPHKTKIKETPLVINIIELCILKLYKIQNQIYFVRNIKSVLV